MAASLGNHHQQPDIAIKKVWSGKEKDNDNKADINKEALVNACVNEVMRILKRAKER